ncbi:unnamed protein product [Mytilus coruscus]|uniref:TIR domain-containing protein n=1 Tax=Mytilus coruscus TaxID=42192 RepID=A0A6J8ABE8_MYTCO|nr:unnamed protein product [Mytilus coruscus]
MFANISEPLKTITLIVGIIECNKILHLSDCAIKYVIKKTQEVKLADCKNRGLNFIPQNLPGDINVLDLSSNQLTAINNDSFVNYEYLQELILGKNQLKDLSNESFKGLSNLVALDMSHNMLDLSKVYSAEIFLPIKNLTKLDIRSNMPQPIDFDKDFIYPDHVFGVLSELSFLGIDMMPVPRFGKGFSHITYLRELHFQSCYLVSLSNTTFQAFPYFVQELSLTNCRLKAVRTEDDVLLPFPHLRVIDFHGTFMHLRRALHLLHPYSYSNLTTINFGHVSDASIDSSELPFVITITPDMMKYLKTICVENLDLSNNGIVDYESGSLFTFDRPECLQTLSFKRNRFVIVTKRTISDFNSFCEKAVLLKSIDYSYNAVNYIMNNSVISNLEIDSYHGSYVTFPKSLEKFDMSNTILTTYPEVWIIVPENNTLKYLDVSYARTNMPLFFLQIRIETFISTGLYETAWREIKRFPEHNLKTVVWKEAYLNEGIEKQGNRLFDVLTSVESLDISRNNIWYFPNELLKPMPNLSSLYLGKNLLQAIPEQLIGHTKIKMLDVRNNLLTSVSSAIRNWADKMQERHGMSLYLDGNAFMCNCDNLDLIRWIKTTKVDLDSESYKCELSNGTVTDTLTAYNSFSHLFADCKSTMWLTFASTLLATSGTISLLLVLYSKRWKIAFFVYGIIQSFIEQKVRKRYQYDVYMSYEGEIVIWIKHVLVPRLEAEWGLTMCIRDRDFLGGESLLDIEAECIQKSRYIIFLITPEFKSSNDCMFELDRAKYERVTRNLDKIIVITKDIKITDIPYEFSYIWNYAYLVQWPNDQGDLDDTWRRLRMLFTEGSVANKQVTL